MRGTGSASAFLLDDVHLVADKDRTQDELFVLFNFLIESGRQMIFSSARALGGADRRSRHGSAPGSRVAWSWTSRRPDREIATRCSSGCS